MVPSEETLAEVGKLVLESMAFALVSADSVVAGDGDVVCEGTVRFSGPAVGAVSIRMPEAVLAELGSGMLALEDDASCSKQQQEDVLGELTNVFCGNLLEALGGSARAFDLGTRLLQILLIACSGQIQHLACGG